MDNQTLLSSELDPNKICFSEAKSQKIGGNIKSSRVSYFYGNNTDESNRLIIQTARMKIPFGINNDEKFGDGSKWDVRLSFQGEERSKKIMRFRECIEKINEAVKTKCAENSKDWFGKEYKRDILEEFFKSTIKTSKKEGYSDMFRVSIPFNKENTAPNGNIEFFNDKEEPISWHDVTPGSEVICLIEINSVWIAPGTKQFGIIVKLLQMQVFPSKQLRGYQMRSDTDANGDEDNSVEEEEEEIIEETVDEDDI
jgi:hypothetical protein